MTATTTWYLKRGSGVSGPFTAGRIKRDIVLGRIGKSDSLSADRATWFLVADVAEFASLERAAPGTDAFSRYDERESERRDPVADGAGSAGGRRGCDRRRDEAATVRSRRANSKLVWQSLREPKPRAVMAWLMIAASSAVTLFLAVNLGPPAPQVADCTEPARPAVNWVSCRHENADLRHADLHGALLKNADLSSGDFAGANLAGSDLAYADLRAADFTLANLELARLVGANLRRANLRHTNLKAADLQYADLSDASIDGADLEGARLSNAIWVGGRPCAQGSVGTCVPP